MRRSWQITLLCTSFLFGIILAANFQFGKSYYLFLSFAVFSVVAIAVVKSKLGYVLFIALGLVLGLWRFEYFWQNKLPDASIFDSQKVTVVGTVEGEPRWDEYRNYVFYLSSSTVNNTKVEGLVRIKALAGQVKEGQQVKAEGKLKNGQGKASTYISYAKVDILNNKQPIMIQVKQAFVGGLNTALPTNTAAFMSGILIGSRSALEKSYTDILTALGLSHIVAVSGYNLTILIGFLNKRFLKSWRWGSLVASLWIVLGFVVIAGASASILRAGIMSAVFLLANYYGKRLNIVVCMALVAMAMVAVQPQSILSDVGWQLSFLSLFGITLLAPKISNVLPKKPSLLNDILSVALAAQIATAGLVMYKFGQISLLSPLSNLIIMPFIPTLMLLGFISAAVGILLPSVAYLFVGRFIDFIVLTIFDLLAYLSHWSFTVIKISNHSLVLVAIYYIVVIVIALVLRDSNSQHSFFNLKNDKIEEHKKVIEPKRKELNSVRT